MEPLMQSCLTLAPNGFWSLPQRPRLFEQAMTSSLCQLDLARPEVAPMGRGPSEDPLQLRGRLRSVLLSSYGQPIPTSRVSWRSILTLQRVWRFGT